VDAAPTSQQAAAAGQIQQEAQLVITRWNQIPQKISALNRQLEAAGLEKIDWPTE
jgi:hypothetical protein